MKDHTVLTIFAMAMLTILELYALYKGIDGQIFSLVVAVIAGLAGYKIKEKLQGDTLPLPPFEKRR